MKQVNKFVKIETMLMIGISLVLIIECLVLVLLVVFE